MAAWVVCRSSTFLHQPKEAPTGGMGEPMTFGMNEWGRLLV